jgi:hypothetical protein
LEAEDRYNWHFLIIVCEKFWIGADTIIFNGLWKCLRTGRAAYEDSTSAFSGRGVELSAKLSEKHFGYLSTKDAYLIRDAVLLECDVFLTMERKLPRNSAHIEQELGIKVLQPIGYWDLLRPWAALLA